MNKINIPLLLFAIVQGGSLQCMHAAQTKSHQTRSKNTYPLLIATGAVVLTATVSWAIYKIMISRKKAQTDAQEKARQEEKAIQDKVLQEKTAFYTQLEERVKVWVSNGCLPEGFSIDPREITHYIAAAHKYLNTSLYALDKGDINTYIIQACALIRQARALRAKYENVRILMGPLQQQRFTEAHKNLTDFDAQVCKYGLSSIEAFIKTALAAEGADPETVKQTALTHLQSLCETKPLYDLCKPTLENIFDQAHKERPSRVAAC